MSSSSPSPNLTLQRPAPQPRRWPASLRRGLIALFALLCLAALWRYGWPRQVPSWTMQRAPLDITVTGPAILDAIFKADLSTRIAGKLTGITVDRNERVVTGQLIATVEQDDLRQQVAAARANLLAAQGALRVAQANQASAEAALANSRVAFQRQAQLIKDRWTSQASYDQALATLREDQALVAAQQQTVAQARAQIAAAAAALQVDQVQLDIATVRAPFTGVVAVRNKNQGDVLTAGSSIMQIVDPQSIVLTSRFDESVIDAVHPGQAAQIRFAFDPQHAVPGKVLRLSRQVDPETREFTADVTPDSLPKNWALDQRANVTILIQRRPQALAVPASYVVTRHGQTGVWKKQGGRAHWRQVRLAGNEGERVEVLQGLDPGDVVLAPQGVYPFMPVRD